MTRAKPQHAIPGNCADGRPAIGLLDRHAVFDTDNVQTARSSAVLFERKESLEALHPADDFRMSVNSLLLSDIRISVVATTGHRIRLIENDSLTLLLPRTGTLETRETGDWTQGKAGSMVVPKPGPRTTVCSPAYIGLVVQIPLARLHRLAAHNPEDRWQLDGHPLGVVDVTAGEGAVLERYLRYLAQEFDQPDALLTSSRASAGAASFLAELLGDVWRASLARSVPPTRPASLLQVERAEELIRDRMCEPLSITGLAGEIGVSTRALQLAFQRHRGIRPHQALEIMRLDASHARLVAASPADNVTAIAFDLGMTHLGRFAMRYRARFGELPVTTLRRSNGLR